MTENPADSSTRAAWILIMSSALMILGGALLYFSAR